MSVARDFKGWRDKKAQEAFNKRESAKRNADASEKRIVKMQQDELKKMMASAEKAEAQRRAEAEFKKISSLNKGATKGSTKPSTKRSTKGSAKRGGDKRG